MDLEHDPSILFQYEDERMSMEDKQKLFISILKRSMMIIHGFPEEMIWM